MESRSPTVPGGLQRPEAQVVRSPAYDPMCSRDPAHLLDRNRPRHLLNDERLLRRGRAEARLAGRGVVAAEGLRQVDDDRSQPAERTGTRAQAGMDAAAPADAGDDGNRSLLRHEGHDLHDAADVARPGVPALVATATGAARIRRLASLPSVTAPRG